MKTNSKSSAIHKSKSPAKAKANHKAVPVDRAHQAKEFPGYPPYSPSEDIMNKGVRIDTDIESAKAKKTSDIKAKQNPVKPDDTPMIDTDQDEEDIIKDQFEVTDEDLEALGPEELSMDMGADEELKHRSRPVDFSGKDLDVPGSELDDAAESTGSEDEENNSYSIGGDGHNDLEEGGSGKS
ncbi:hypothetical protein BH09BAC3_BH09BAC3_26070 [soil metagenome]